ncbi:ABC transporter substrate-binding protein [Corynebacterium lubricantis]|uniref:ABC transporter substrate-binding protein n=1 Tax=Corynebacterium lubricantis TaxID=541095 RepID=UPI00037F9855|nr:ABC transporter substrate-binding protein [Corynebacterium lubricantis]
MKKIVPVLILAPALALGLTGCTTSSEASDAAITVENCGNTFSLDAAPERVVLQDASSVETLSQLGVLDRVVAKAGFFPEVYFDDETNAQLADIPTLSDRLNTSGHLEISKEAVMAESPDLIIGYSNSVSADTVSDVPVINEPGFCGEVHDASIEDVNDQIDLYATLFDESSRAESLKEDVASRVAALDQTAGEGKTVAVVYPGIEGATMYAYGKDSMSNPVVTSVGLTNVFGDQQDRVFEISAEQLVAANPDVILLLHSGESGAVDAVTTLPGADAITAVRENQILLLELAFAEPPTPLAVDGAEKLEAFLQG